MQRVWTKVLPLLVIIVLAGVGITHSAFEKSVHAATSAGSAQDAAISQLASSNADSDFDGCSDKEELGSNPRQGGQRDPNNAFDFFDVDGDRAVTYTDVFEVAARNGNKLGDPDYDLGYDRAHIGPKPWNLGPGDGVINTTDILAVLRQLGHKCEGPPPPDLDLVCDKLRWEASSEGITDFVCSTQPLPAKIEMDGEEGTKREVQVGLSVGNSVEVKTLDLTVVADVNTSNLAVVTEEDSSQRQGGSSETMNAASFHPPICKVVVCRVTLSRKVELRHLWGSGPNCAWMRYTQKYKVYYPWHAIFEVRNPAVSSGASFPCNESNRSSGIDRHGQPFWAESWARIKWVAGIPTPWGVIGLRTFHPEIRAWFNGRYRVDWN